MEDNKYYYPEPSELYIGYEAECCFSSYGGYAMFDTTSDKMVLHEPEDKEAAKHWVKFWLIEEEGMWTANNQRDMKTALMILKDKRLRTKYLDKTDIEECGWVFIEPTTLEGEEESIYKLGQYTLCTMSGNHILITDPKNYGCRYKGKCPSINELKTLMKWLNINK